MIEKLEDLKKTAGLFMGMFWGIFVVLSLFIYAEPKMMAEINNDILAQIGFICFSLGSVAASMGAFTLVPKASLLIYDAVMVSVTYCVYWCMAKEIAPGITVSIFPVIITGIQILKKILIWKEGKNDVERRVVDIGYMETVKEDVCDTLCKYPGMYTAEEWEMSSDKVCCNCPLDRL